MSVNDYIARGVAPIGQGLPGVAQMLEQRRQHQSRLAVAKEELTYRRGRDEAADKKAATKEELGHALARVEWALTSKSPREALLSDPKAVENLGKQGIDVNALDDTAATEMLTKARASLASQLGEGPPAAAKGGAPVKVNRGGKMVWEDPQAAVGQEVGAADGEGGVNSQLTSRPAGPGMKQDYAFNPRTNSMTPIGKPYPDTDAGSEGSGVSTDNAIHRQAVAYFGGEIDPVTGEIQILKTDAPRAAAVARMATEFHRKGGMSIAAAVEKAAQMKPWQQNEPARGRNIPSPPTATPAPVAAPRPQAAATAAPAAAPQSYPEGTRAAKTLPDGSQIVIELRGGQWVQVGGPGG